MLNDAYSLYKLVRPVGEKLSVIFFSPVTDGGTAYVSSSDFFDCVSDGVKTIAPMLPNTAQLAAILASSYDGMINDFMQQSKRNCIQESVGAAKLEVVPLTKRSGKRVNSGPFPVNYTMSSYLVYYSNDEPQQRKKLQGNLSQLCFAFVTLQQ